MKRVLTTTVLFALFLSTSAYGQVNRIDLSTIIGNDLSIVQNRSASIVESDTRKGLHLNEQSGSGVAWLTESVLHNGSIEVDVRGRNDPGRSFVGIAFHREDDAHYEVIYLRPFNFKNEARKAHSVQYVYEPDYGWSRLREEHPGKYEAAIVPAPDPTDWVRLRLELDDTTVRAFIDEIKEPVLTVERISTATSGRIGLWVGNNSGGDFANLTIEPR